MADHEPRDDDLRDERVAESLRVEPLDDLTRRRLVSRALQESRRPSHALRWIAVAAGIVVVLFGVVALLTAPGGNDEQRASTPARAPDRAAKAATAPVDVGNLGDLSRAANLNRLQTRVESNAAGATGSASAAAAPTPPVAPPCRDQLPRGTIAAVGTGTLDGRTAVVVLTTLPDGSRSIDAVFTDPCEVRHLS